MKTSLLPVLAALAMAACTPAVPPEDPMPDMSAIETCGADRMQAMVGRPWNETLVIPGKVIRLITPGMAVTMDYSPDRLNVELDETGTIRAITCG